jgi:23S rRNA pseudouridine1911/1915/1917 synthase
VTEATDDPVPDDEESTDHEDSESTSNLIARGGKVDRDALFAFYAAGDDGDSESQARVQFTLSRDLQKRLDRYLVDKVPFMSRTTLQKLIAEDAVTVNGRSAKASTKLRKGDVVQTTLPPPPSNAIPPEELPLDILYEDDELIVINKQPDLIVHPARGNRSGTLINALSWHFQNRTSGGLSTVGEDNCRPGVVHRLDRHTSGVMVAAKSDTAHWRLGRQFEQRQTRKRYLAVVHGEITPFADRIDHPLGKHPTVRELYAVRYDELAKDALTIYRVREAYEGFTLVELELHTGRTHQIRVHLSYLGFPIVGDDRYGGRHLIEEDLDSSLGSQPLISRQALHATTLGFTHPITEQPVLHTAPLRPDMARLVTLLRTHRMKKQVDAPGATIDLDQVL